MRRVWIADWRCFDCRGVAVHGGRLRKLSTQCQRRVMLTGTPLQNDLGELAGLLQFLLPDIFTSYEELENEVRAPLFPPTPNRPSATPPRTASRCAAPELGAELTPSGWARARRTSATRRRWPA